MTEAARPFRPGSLRSILTGVLSLLQNRAQLASLEAQEQLERLIGHVVLALLAVVSALIGFIALLLFLAVALPPPWRVAVLGAIALLFALFTLTCLLCLAWRLKHAPQAFTLTRAELQKDWRLLSNKERS